MTDNSRPLILLTNDDGFEALGIRAMRQALSPWGEVIVVAPREERSAASHSLTIHHPVRIEQVDESIYAVSGTPVDCVLLAMHKVLPRLPDLVVSGINHGQNLGDDVLYSGTVAAAREAAVNGIPAVAASLVSPRRQAFIPAADQVARLLDRLFPGQLRPGIYLNVNIPSESPRGIRFTRQGNRRTAGSIQEKRDPRGRLYYWIAADQLEPAVEADTDLEAVSQGFVSITPLQRDQTDYRSLERFCNHNSDAKALVEEP